MNFVKGGPRVTVVLMILQFLVIGGITLNVAFFESVPTDRPFAKFFPLAVLGAGIAAIFATYLSHVAVRDTVKEPNFTGSGAQEFVLSIWGMAASFIGWIVGVGCAVAFLGGWGATGSWVFKHWIGAALSTSVAISLIFIAPLVVILFFAWLWEGFSSK